MNMAIVILVIVVISIVVLVSLFIGYKIGRKFEDRHWKSDKLEPIVKDRLKLSRAVLGGQFSEQLAPYLPDFPYNPIECRFIGKPIDFLVFKGMNNKEIEEVIFVEVKSGKGKTLKKHERNLRDIIKNRKVRWEKYEIPDEIVKKQNE